MDKNRVFEVEKLSSEVGTSGKKQDGFISNRNANYFYKDDNGVIRSLSFDNILDNAGNVASYLAKRFGDTTVDKLTIKNAISGFLKTDANGVVSVDSFTGEHNSLSGLQGGTTTERLHLTTSEKGLLHDAVTVTNPLTINGQEISLSIGVGLAIGSNGELYVTTTGGVSEWTRDGDKLKPKNTTDRVVVGAEESLAPAMVEAYSEAVPSTTGDFTLTGADTPEINGEYSKVDDFTYRKDADHYLSRGDAQKYYWVACSDPNDRWNTGFYYGAGGSIGEISTPEGSYPSVLNGHTGVVTVVPSTGSSTGTTEAVEGFSTNSKIYAEKAIKTSTAYELGSKFVTTKNADGMPIELSSFTDPEGAIMIREKINAEVVIEQQYSNGLKRLPNLSKDEIQNPKDLPTLEKVEEVAIENGSLLATDPIANGFLHPNKVEVFFNEATEVLTVKTTVAQRYFSNGVFTELQANEVLTADFTALGFSNKFGVLYLKEDKTFDITNAWVDGLAPITVFYKNPTSNRYAFMNTDIHGLTMSSIDKEASNIREGLWVYEGLDTWIGSDKLVVYPSTLVNDDALVEIYSTDEDTSDVNSAIFPKMVFVNSSMLDYGNEVYEVKDYATDETDKAFWKFLGGVDTSKVYIQALQGGLVETSNPVWYFIFARPDSRADKANKGVKTDGNQWLIIPSTSSVGNINNKYETFSLMGSELQYTLEHYADFIVDMKCLGAILVVPSATGRTAPADYFVNLSSKKLSELRLGRYAREKWDIKNLYDIFVDATRSGAFPVVGDDGNLTLQSLLEFKDGEVQTNNAMTKARSIAYRDWVLSQIPAEKPFLASTAEEFLELYRDVSVQAIFATKTIYLEGDLGGVGIKHIFGVGLNFTGATPVTGFADTFFHCQVFNNLATIEVAGKMLGFKTLLSFVGGTNFLNASEYSLVEYFENRNGNTGDLVGIPLGYWDNTNRSSGGGSTLPAEVSFISTQEEFITALEDVEKELLIITNYFYFDNYSTPTTVRGKKTVTGVDCYFSSAYFIGDGVANTGIDFINTVSGQYSVRADNLVLRFTGVESISGFLPTWYELNGGTIFYERAYTRDSEDKRGFSVYGATKKQWRNTNEDAVATVLDNDIVTADFLVNNGYRVILTNNEDPIFGQADREVTINAVNRLTFTGMPANIGKWNSTYADRVINISTSGTAIYFKSGVSFQHNGETVTFKGINNCAIYITDIVKNINGDYVTTANIVADNCTIIYETVASGVNLTAINGGAIEQRYWSRNAPVGGGNLKTAYTPTDASWTSGQTYNYDVTVTGASAGDGVAVTLNEIIGDALSATNFVYLEGYVSSANTVSVRVRVNEWTDTLNDRSGKLVVTVLK